MKNRKNIRIKEFDYSTPGYYFFTICVYQRECILGEIFDNKIVLNDFGLILEKTWFDLPNHNNNIFLDYYQIMPNHFHGIIQIVGDGSKPSLTKPSQLENHVGDGSKPSHMEPSLTKPFQLENNVGVGSKPTLQKPSHTEPSQRAGYEPAPTFHGLPEIIRQLKTFSSKRINEKRNLSGQPVWQRNYFEHIIRNDNELNRIRFYILNNPQNWLYDSEKI